MNLSLNNPTDVIWSKAASHIRKGMDSSLSWKGSTSSRMVIQQVQS